MPATDKLTDPAIKKAKPETKLHERSDGGGLFLLVQPSGAKGWRLKYRHGGKVKLRWALSRGRASIGNAHLPRV
jgi:hypothetical protein